MAERSATGGRLGSPQKKSPRVKRGAVESSESLGLVEALGRVRSVRATAKAIISRSRCGCRQIRGQSRTARLLPSLRTLAKPHVVLT